LAKKLRRKFYERKVKDLHASDPHNWWRNVKQFLGKSSSGNDLDGLCNSLCDGDFNDLANRINEFLSHVADDLQPLSDDFLSNLHVGTEFLEDFIIYPSMVELKLSNVSVNKAPGPDLIPNWFLKEMATFITNPVCAIFNASIRQGFVPDIWKRANVIPIPKSHPPKTIHSDLRPISLTSTLCKILESFVGRWILDRIEGQLDPNQFGALRGRSTSHALVSITDLWCQSLDSGGSVRTVFVDYTKAFDRVDHTLLLNKLLALWVPHPLLFLIS
jgi:hypothetical protein